MRLASVSIKSQHQKSNLLTQFPLQFGWPVILLAVFLQLTNEYCAMKILIAIDGSDCSKDAIASTIHSKYPSGAEIRVISVVDFFEPLPALQDIKEKQIDEAKQLVEKTIDQLQKALANVKVSGSVLDGYATDEIVKEAQDWNADLIIAGSHGRTGVASLVLGSVSRALLVRSHCAVRIVRSEKVSTNGDNNVLIAMDRSPSSSHTIDHVIATPWPLGTKFKCMTAVAKAPKHMVISPTSEQSERIAKYESEMQQQAQTFLDEQVNRLDQAYDQAIADPLVVLGDARESVLAEATDWPAHLIIVGSHGKRGLSRLMLGSVSEAVALHAPCSVEVTRLPSER